MSRVYSIKKVQQLPVSLEAAWEFFSKPSNLPDITPPALNFRIISASHGDKMYPGQIIEYKVSPLLGISLYWMTEITQVEPMVFFIDEQRQGPYRLWHHQHHFKPIDGGVEMTDILHYKLPFWILGDIANSFFIKKQLQSIFDFRYQKAEAVFGKWTGE